MKNRLRELRKQENKTLLQVSELLAISTQSLSAYETGTRDLNTDILCKLSDFYGVSIDYILCRDTVPDAQRHLTEDATLKAILDIYETLSREQWLAIAEILKSENR